MIAAIICSAVDHSKRQEHFGFEIVSEAVYTTSRCAVVAAETKMMRSSSPFPAAVALLVSFAAPSLAQVATFDLGGTILDETGAPLPDVQLTIVNAESGLTRSVHTNLSGHYLLAELPAGVYNLEISLPGYATTRYAGLRYFADTKPVLNDTLRPGAVQTSMTITGEAPLINASFAQIGQSVDDLQLVELPLENRDYLDLVTIAAGVTDVTQFIPGSTVLGSKSQNINGSYARYTSYQLDGFNNTRDQHGVAKVDLGLDAVEEFRVLTNQQSAEYGQSMAGIVSAVTKSGGNDYHGSAFVFIRPGGLDASDPLTGEATTLDRQDVGFTFSGPIVEDRTHFFTAFEYRNQDQDVAVTATVDDGRYQGLFPVGENHARFLAKVSHELSRDHQLEAKLIWNDETILDGVGGLEIFENRRENRNDDIAVQATISSVLGGNRVNQLRFGFIDETYDSSAQAPPGGPVLVYPTQGIIGNANRFQSANESQWEISDTLSWVHGRHSLKVGFDFFRVATDAALQVAFDGVYEFSPSTPFPFVADDPSTHPLLYTQGFFAPGAPGTLERSENHIQVFFQDDWQIRADLTVSLGLRWEKESSVPDNNNVAPRLGFHWDATRDGQTAVRGGYGVFYNYLFSAIESFEIFSSPDGFFTASFAPDDPLFPQFPDTLPGPVLPPGVERPPGNNYLEAAAYSPESRRSPYTQQFTLGIERQILPRVSLAVDATYLLGQNIVLPFDINAPAHFDYATGGTRSSAAADETRPFGVPGTPIDAGDSPFVSNPFPFGGYRDLYLLDSRGTSHYWGIKVNVTRRYSNNFMIQGTYTWSRTQNDGDDFRPENSLPLDPGNYDGEWARSATDVPHALVVNGVWDAPYEIRVAGLFRARSGRTVDPRVNADLDGDNKTRERAFSDGRVLERNSFRAKSVITLDFALSKLFELGRGRTIEGRVDIFNIANRLNPGQVLNSYGPDAANPLPSFLTVASARPPRQVQFSARFRF